MPGGNSPTTTGAPIKILMLHGYTQSGTLFRAKTRALEKNLQKAFPSGISLHYPTAPIRLLKADIPRWDDPNIGSFNPTRGDAAVKEQDQDDDMDSWGWWKRRGEGEPYYYEGMEKAFERVAEVMKTEGPFDGVIGFSQGGAMAGMVASLLEPGRRAAFQAAQAKGGMPYPKSFEADTFSGDTNSVHPPLKFAVSYSGFGASANDLYQAFYEPKITTPMLHVIGSLDTVVVEKRSLLLVDACVDGDREGRVVYHPGGHFLPSSQKQYVGALIGFIREIMESQNSKPEEKAEDMDLPF